MQFTLAFVAAALASVAVAAPSASTGPTCSTGPIQCCQSVVAATSAQAVKQAGLANVAVGPLTGLVGLTCTSVAGSAW